MISFFYLKTIWWAFIGLLHIIYYIILMSKKYDGFLDDFYTFKSVGKIWSKM